jgi:hypothetical protein
MEVLLTLDRVVDNDKGEQEELYAVVCIHCGKRVFRFSENLFKLTATGYRSGDYITLPRLWWFYNSTGQWRDTNRSKNELTSLPCWYQCSKHILLRLPYLLTIPG